MCFSVNSSSDFSSFLDLVTFITDDKIHSWPFLDGASPSTSETPSCSSEEVYEDDGKNTLEEICEKPVRYSERETSTPDPVPCIAELEETKCPCSSKEVYKDNGENVLKEILEKTVRYSEWEKVSTPDPVPCISELEKPRRFSKRLQSRSYINYKDFLRPQYIWIEKKSRLSKSDGSQLAKRVSPIDRKKRQNADRIENIVKSPTAKMRKMKETRDNETQTNPLLFHVLIGYSD